MIKTGFEYSSICNYAPIYVYCVYTIVLQPFKGGIVLEITDKIREKLKNKHNVSENMVREAFANRQGCFLKDQREEHGAIPPTHWFVSETDNGIKLKVCFIHLDGVFYIKTAYRANLSEQRIYEKYGS